MASHVHGACTADTGVRTDNGYPWCSELIRRLHTCGGESTDTQGLGQHYAGNG